MDAHNRQFKLLDKFVDLHKMGRVWQGCMIRAKLDTPHDYESYDYTDRYAIKDQDPKEHRFSADTQTSKNYELIIEKHSSMLVPDIKDFLWTNKAQNTRNP